MTIFVLVCGAMVVAALILIARPLLTVRVAAADEKAGEKASGKRKSGNRYIGVIVLATLIPLVTGLLYAKYGHVNWQQELAASTPKQKTTSPEVAAMIAKLERRMSEAPGDIDGWLLLGRSYTALDKTALALNAYQKAYDLNSENVEATLGLGEAMVATDERAIAGKAGQLFEAALARAPDNSKALWYGAVSALTAGDLPRAHERLQHILVFNPPENVRTIIEQQLKDIEQQLTAGGQPAPPAPQNVPAKPAQSARALIVQVSLSPSMEKNLDKKTPLFVLARDPAAPGPPLAAVRRAVGDLPLSVAITDNDAMMAGHGIDSVARVQVVARISKSGTPQAQPGDLYGEANVSFAGSKPVNVKITIDHIVAANEGAAKK